MNRTLFGTDGVRGLAGEYPLDAEGIQRIGAAVGSLFAKPGQQVVIGCDTRQSSAEIVQGLADSLNTAGINVVTTGVITTPGLAYVTRETPDFVAGIMVTASHNPYQYNGIKVFTAEGGKLSDDIEGRLNELVEAEALPAHPALGTTRADVTLIMAYEDFLVASADGLQLAGRTIALDMANGSASGLATRVFGRLGASVTPLFDQPDGQNINAMCGATDTGTLRETVTTQHLDLGIALDGDADRLIMADNLGREVKGDYLLYILAVANRCSGVVATIMSNMGFELALQRRGIELVRTAVGDRYVLEGLEKTGYHLGGEESGHIILPELLATGDGLLAAVQITKALTTSAKSLAEWCDEVSLLPQAMVNIPLSDKALLQDDEVRGYIDRQSAIFDGNGRVLIRASGTEPLLRVMVEAPSAEAEARRIADELEKLLTQSLKETA